jgi:hypothetical protein
MAVDHRAEELMRLQDKLTAKPILVVNYDGINALFSEFYSCGHTRWSSAENQNISFNREGLPDFRTGKVSQFGKAFKAFYLHSLLKRNNAALTRNAVYEKSAL